MAGQYRPYDTFSPWGRRTGNIELPAEEVLPMPTPPLSGPGAKAAAFNKYEPIPPVVPEYLDVQRSLPGRGDIPYQQQGGGMMRGMANMAGGSQAQTMGALAGLQAAQGDQYSPFSEFELSSMASRDPNTVAPGSNQIWQSRLNEMQSNRKFNLDAEQARQKAIADAQASLHPALQQSEFEKARRAAMPSQAAAAGQIRSAQIAGQSRLGAAQEAARSRNLGAARQQVDGYTQAIARIIAEAGGKPLTPQAEQALKWLKNQQELYTRGSNDTDEIDMEEFLYGR